MIGVLLLGLQEELLEFLLYLVQLKKQQFTLFLSFFEPALEMLGSRLLLSLRLVGQRLSISHGLVQCRLALPSGPFQRRAAFLSGLLQRRMGLQQCRLLGGRPLTSLDQGGEKRYCRGIGRDDVVPHRGHVARVPVSRLQRLQHVPHLGGSPCVQLGELVAHRVLHRALLSQFCLQRCQHSINACAHIILHVSRCLARVSQRCLVKPRTQSLQDKVRWRRPKRAQQSHLR